ncbi:hypothetical protein [Staphylococcus pseudintermedius]|uniref:hypothetical protein n=1 Tax=Staphylococcus pseudintermedius TaxID=283734 RepID=UPI001056F57C|nr:hypothetical protein [Staphylococcus pseudintermedius]
MDKANYYLISVFMIAKFLIQNFSEKLLEAKNELIINARNKDLQFNAWFIVLLAVILVIATTIFAGLTIWCLTTQHGKFTGNWHWGLRGVSISVECKK